MSALRRPLARSQRRMAPYVDPHYPQKQETRDRVAREIANHFGDHPAPTVFVLPSYQALCAQTIDKLVPRAVFYGTDYYRSVVEKTDAVNADGKTIQMGSLSGKPEPKNVRFYIRDNAGKIAFDAAFLDYKTTYQSVRSEVRDFVEKMLQAKAVFAITVQCLDGQAVLDQMIGDLQPVATVTLLHHMSYQTTAAMLNAIFLLTK